MITERNLPIHEMIGLKVTISQSTNSQIIGLNGTIIDETKNMFVLNTDKGVKKIPKNINTWKFLFDNNCKKIKGVSLIKRSYDRLRGKYD